MHEFTPWLGICHLGQVDDGSPDAQPTLVAVWADSVERFERELHVHTNSHGLQMIWAEDVMPAEEWLVQHSNRKDAQRLVDKVSAKHLVALGGFGVRATGLGSDGVPNGVDEGYLHIEEIEGVEPLDMQFGVHPPKTVPDALYEPLFGQPDPTPDEVAQYGSEDKVPQLNTYAILDAAKVVNFVEMLEASGLEHRCLFKGEAAEEMRDVAPYVVRLEEGNDFTHNLFSKDPEQEVPWFMWDKEPGIYIRSRGSLEDMWKHFRKFTKVQDEDGKWFYFRFWEARTLSVYLRRVRDFAERFLINRMRFGAMQILLIRTGNAELISAGPSLPSNNLAPIFILGEADKQVFRDLTFEIRAHAILKKLKRTFPTAPPSKSDDAYLSIIQQSMHRMRNYGFTQKLQQERLATWEIFYGLEFERSDPALFEICKETSISSGDKFVRFTKRISEVYP